jgi:mitogen-activated protein kinase kinase
MSRPPAVALRANAAATPRRTLTDLIGVQGSTPIPPSLQARMAAVCRLSLRSFYITVVFQMANRQSPMPAVDFGAAFERANNVSPIHPTLHAASSFPIARGRGGGMATRRMRPALTLKDIDPSLASIPTGGAMGAGLGAGRPSLADDAPKRPPPKLGSPFSNFSKIVCVNLAIRRTLVAD